MRLNELRDNPGAKKKAKRVGRGPGSGIGKTGGRGIKGQKSRSGVAINAFEGGQMPLYRRLPKRGFNNPFAKKFAVTNLGAIQRFIEAGKIEAGAPITEDVLLNSGLIRRKRDGVRVLGKLLAGEDGAAKALPKGLKIEVTGASQSAVDAVEAAGGTLTVTIAPKNAAKAEG
ncbi:MAG: 50S ribosomal protein L15 [Pseudomonadota bacterium]